VIAPYSGKVINTDRSTRYPDASDHNMVYARVRINNDQPDETSAQIATFNVRRYAFDLGTLYDWDKYRDSRAAHAIADSGASILALQECEPEQDVYLFNKLKTLTGVPWQAVSNPTNVGLMFKADRWRLLTWRNLLMDNGSEPDRRLVLALLQSVRTGAAVWFGSTHFGVGSVLANYRILQARAVCNYLINLTQRPGEETLPANLFGDVRKNAVIMGDFNDWNPVPVPGVRQVFKGYGMIELRDRLTGPQMDGDSMSTKHSFGKLTPRDGRQIDAIFTSS
jgi:endonuclease/exonuclease/phosphatase family metal-dependent hydrolase